MWRFHWTIWALFLSFGVRAQVVSYFETGEWIKLAITSTGVYELEHNDLQQAGLSLGNANSTNFQIFGFAGNGTIPQTIGSGLGGRPVEIAIQVEDGGDGTFDPGDRILFFGKSPHFVQFNEALQQYEYEPNIYTDTSYYFLTVSELPGRRIEFLDDPGPGTVTNTAFQYVVHEIDDFNLLSSGRSWYGERFEPGNRRTFDLEIDFSDPRITGSFMGSSLSESTFSLFANGNSIGQLELPARIENDKTRAYEDSETFSLSEVFDGSIEIDFSTGDSQGYGMLNRLVVSGMREIAGSEEQTYFSLTSAASSSTFQIGNSSETSRIWNVTDYVNPKSVVLLNGRFNYLMIESSDWVLFDSNNLLQVVEVSPLRSHELKTGIDAEVLIVAYDSFLEEASRLAEHRQEYSGLQTLALPVSEVFNEYGSGRPDITAIRDLIFDLYQNGNLKHVLLFGDASFDYKKRVSPNTNLVPTYQSINSLNEAFSYGSDDYYGFMQEGEGPWEESLSGDHSLELGIGRLPVKTLEEARNIVDKIISYDWDSPLGTWRTKWLFTADDGDSNVHQHDANQIADEVYYDHFLHHPGKLFIDDYAQTDAFSEEANKAFYQKSHEGQLVVSYLGHGNEFHLAQERIVSDFEIEGWQNDLLPFFTTLTCDFGVFDNPDWFSTGERLLLQSDKGAIGLMTATRLVLANVNEEMNRSFMEELYTKSSNGYRTLGEVFRVVKNKNLLGRINRNYSLLGDPSMKLKIPEFNISLDSIYVNGTNRTGFALNSTNVLYGSVLDGDDEVLSSFDGEILFDIYDSPVERTTLGDESEPFIYEAYSSYLFKGKATVRNGKFEIETFLPNSSEEEAGIKWLAYAKDESNFLDAAGGGFNEDVDRTTMELNDNRGPGISIFIDDLNFRSGDEVLSNSTLLVQLSDETGIDLRATNEGPSLVAHLDGQAIDLAQHFSSDLDDFNSGLVRYPLYNLENGRHEITIMSKDLLGNPSEQYAHFLVSENSQSLVYNFKSFPVPSQNQDIYFSFRPANTFGNLKIVRRIYNMQGTILVSSTENLDANDPVVQEILWSEEEQVRMNAGPSVYFYRVIIQSEEGMTSQELSGKLLLR